MGSRGHHWPSQALEWFSRNALQLLWAAAAAKPSAERREAAGTELRVPPRMHLNLTR